MLRKITFSVLTFMTICAYADGRQRSVGTGVSEAALAPKVVPGTTVSGTVTAINGNIISLAGGLVTINASGAKITDERGATGSIASITPGMTVFAVLSASTFTAGDALPASVIAVHHVAQVTLSGPVEAVGANSLTVLGRTITVDANTSFGGHGRSLSEILPNDVVIVEANAVGGALVAASIMTVPPMPKMPTLIHGTVKSIGTDTWVITDNAGKEWTIVVNGQTKIIGTPKVGDTVEILVNTDNANRYVAVSIMKSPIVMPIVAFSGTVKSITGNDWVISDMRSSRDVTVTVDSKTIITGNPVVNDAVMVTANVDGNGHYTAVTIFKLGIVPPQMKISGVVKSIVPSALACAAPPATCPISYWTIGPAVGLGPDFQVQVTSATKISGDPKVGDSVDVLVEMTSMRMTAIQITKR